MTKLATHLVAKIFPFEFREIQKSEPVRLVNMSNLSNVAKNGGRLTNSAHIHGKHSSNLTNVENIEFGQHLVENLVRIFEHFESENQKRTSEKSRSDANIRKISGVSHHSLGQKSLEFLQIRGKHAWSFHVFSELIFKGAREKKRKQPLRARRRLPHFRLKLRTSAEDRPASAAASAAPAGWEDHRTNGVVQTLAPGSVPLVLHPGLSNSRKLPQRSDLPHFRMEEFGFHESRERRSSCVQCTILEVIR